ncbi:MAG TPA: LysR family transcriptional regulator [Virgibacillus sp.]|nr:LysR family transcriptional regulator [Virgibacillus sp.]HLR68372.1 LysR family transcriptional regulator [Virgibacillus sp.]
MLKNMDYVYAVYVNKSFSKAAEELYISQPALSAAIKKVEEEIGIPLFDRSTNPIKLTEAGEYYIESIEHIMHLEKEMRIHFNQLMEKNQGTINVGGATFFCTYILPSLVRDFQLEHPDYSVNLLEANADDLMKYLRSGVADMIVDVEIKGDPKDFESVVWAEEKVLLAVPASSKVNETLEKYRITFEDVASGQYVDEKYPKVNLHHFKDENFLLLREGNDMYNRSLKMCKKAGFIPNVSMYLDQMLTSFHIACKGTGATFVRAGITNYLEPNDNVYFYKIDDEHAYQNIILYYKKSDPLTKVGKDFIAFLNKRNAASL